MPALRLHVPRHHPPPPPPQLMVDGPGFVADDHCDGPGAQPARNAAHDEFDALHLLRHNTGLGAQRALFEFHHCDNTPGAARGAD